MAAAGLRNRGRMRAIVIGATDGIREDPPRLVDAPHAVSGISRALVQVGVMALRKATVGTRHLERRCLARDAEDRVRVDYPQACHPADSTAAARPASV
jgi:hypothetical protein